MDVLNSFRRNITIKPRWLGVFILLALVSILVLVLEYPARAHQTASLLPPTATAEERLSAERILHEELVTRCIFLPVRLFTGWISFALVMYFASLAFSPVERIRFKQILALEVHAETILVLGNLLSASIGLITGSRPWGVALNPQGVAAFVPAGDGLMVLLLNSINLFQFIYVGALTYGLRNLTAFGKLKSAFIVLLVWGMSLFSNIAMIKFVQERVHLGL